MGTPMNHELLAELVRNVRRVSVMAILTNSRAQDRW